ncbi:hypothetical protein MMF93_30450 [Streptomyces tubbatahanensis]|uniref:Lipoprotein n=1 Tax=Streptomyces tubbatahanensis TaxID=2923272 RepID=A0ABY3Y133_9ACTN|nr:hypothetical protein [Streptomyces tubbatahanensis]UNT00304.1 hypothetical protein MMF93_30450 [Streptomyces tubbatahanensis]
MTTRRTRRTVRSATLVAVAAAAAFSVTACQSSDSDASGSHKAGTSAQSQAQHESDSLTSKSASAARTQTLVDGSKAKISKLGAQHYRAEIVSDGAVIATLDADGRDAGMDGNGMFVTLTPGGHISSWMDAGQQGPGTFNLEGDWKAKVTKQSENHYRAQIIGNDGVMGTIDANGHDAGLDANGISIVLTTGGLISSHA